MALILALLTTVFLLSFFINCIDWGFWKSLSTHLLFLTGIIAVIHLVHGAYLFWNWVLNG